MAEHACSWCGEPVEEDAGFRACEPDGEHQAVFCRLEHVVPWVIQGAQWSPGSALGEDDDPDGLGTCVRCGAELDERRVLLVRHRGPHRIADTFCGTAHLLEWAKAGGRWA
jgi:hypothetical protein